MKKILSLLIVAAVVSGCATKNGVEIAKIAEKGYEKYIDQEKVAPLIHAKAPEGQTVKFNLVIEGAEEVKFNTQVPQLSVMPKENDTLGTVVNGVARLAGIAGASVVGYKGVSALGDIATSPTVVTQPEPLIVNPVIVGAP